jgi:hypothetical protein
MIEISNIMKDMMNKVCDGIGEDQVIIDEKKKLCDKYNPAKGIYANFPISTVLHDDKKNDPSLKEGK